MPIATIIFAMALAPIGKADAADLQLVWQRTYGAPILAAAGVPPKIISTSKKLLFFIESSTSTTELVLPAASQAILARQGNSFALFSFGGPKTTDNQLRFYRLPQESSGAPATASTAALSTRDTQAFLSPDGSRAITFAPYSDKLSFASSSGDILSQHQYPDLRGVTLNFSDDGHAAVNIPNMQQGQTTGKLAFFDPAGKLLWEHPHGQTTGQVAVSKDGSKIVFAGSWQTLCLDAQGNVLWKRPHEWLGQASIGLSSDGSVLALLHNSNAVLEILDASSGGAAISSRTISELDPANSRITAIKLSKTGGLILLTAARHFSSSNQDCWAYLLDKSSNVLWKKHFQDSSVKGDISEDGFLVFIAGSQEAYLYKMGPQ